MKKYTLTLMLVSLLCHSDIQTSLTPSSTTKKETTIHDIFKRIATIPADAPLNETDKKTENIVISDLGMRMVNEIIALALTLKNSEPNEDIAYQIALLAEHPFLQNTDPDKPSLVLVSSTNMNNFTSLFNKEWNENMQWDRYVLSLMFKKACKSIHTKIETFPTVTQQPEESEQNKLPIQVMPAEKEKKEEEKEEEIKTDQEPKKVIEALRTVRSSQKTMTVNKPKTVAVTQNNTQASKIANQPRATTSEPVYPPVQGWNPFVWDWYTIISDIYFFARVTWAKLRS